MRAAKPGLAAKLKLTTPLLMPPMVNHAASLVGANGPLRFIVAGNTTGKTSLPAAAGSALTVVSTNARGHS